MEIDLPASVRLLERRAGGLGRIETFRQHIGDAARRLFVGTRRATKVAPLVRICCSRWSQRFMHGPAKLPQELSTGYRQAYTRLLPACQARTYPRDHTGLAWIPPTSSPAPKLSRPGASPATRAAGTICRHLPSGGEIAVSWFRGPYPEFVAHCRRNFGRGSEAKHQLWPARVAVNGARATAETNVAILVRQTIEGVGSISPPTAASSTGWNGATAPGASSSGGAVRKGPARPGRAVGGSSTP